MSGHPASAHQIGDGDFECNVVGKRPRDDIRSSEYRLMGVVGSAAGVAGMGEDFPLGIDQVHDPVGGNARSCVDAAFEPVSDWKGRG